MTYSLACIISAFLGCSNPLWRLVNQDTRPLFSHACVRQVVRCEKV